MQISLLIYSVQHFESPEYTEDDFIISLSNPISDTLFYWVLNTSNIK